jgi:putative DNA methylase
MSARKKLIEVALPLEAVNKAAAQEKQPGIGAHPRGLHLWWARRPLASARAVIFAQMVDDPSSHTDIFRTEKTQEKERQRLFRIIEDLVKWENTANESVLLQACAENADHPRANVLFDRHKLPAFHDPFAGGGALPLEAQRLGLESYASDLNPVAVLINKAMIEIPPKFACRAPINPLWQKKRDDEKVMTQWRGAMGLAEDVRYYGQWMRDAAEKRIGHLYPQIEITAAMSKERPDLKKYVGQRLTVIAWLWARTVKSPNPAFVSVEVPLVSNFMLSTKPGKESYVEPVIEGRDFRFSVRVGKPKDSEAAKSGTKLARANFVCLMSGAPIAGEYIMAEGKAGRLNARLMAIVAEGERERVYLAPDREHETTACTAKPEWKPDVEFLQQALGFRVGNYGMTMWSDLFTPRQLVGLTTLSDLISEVRYLAQNDALSSGLSGDNNSLSDGGIGAAAYSDALAVYLAFAIDRLADYNSSIATWKPSGEQVMQTFKRQAIPMTWDFPESNVLGQSAICWKNCVKYTADNLETSGSVSGGIGYAMQADAGRQTISQGKVVSTDPPYYDNIGYADLSDFFYVWLRKSLKPVFPNLFATLAVPKVEELVATAARHGGKQGAETFFLDGMTEAMHRLAEQAHPAFPVTIYYAFKQAENDGGEGTASTGWETFLDAAIRAGFAITGTWPMRTEMGNRMRGMDSNALASSVVLVCRKRTADSPNATRREFVTAGLHRPRHGGLHTLYQSARRRRQAALCARSSGTDQPNSRRSTR